MNDKTIYIQPAHSPSQWIKQIFKAASVKNGGIVRRKKVDVDKYASSHELTNQVKSQGFHLIEIGDQYVVICNKGDLKVIC